VIGTISLVYCGGYLALPSPFFLAAHLSTVANIYQLYKYRRRFKETISSDSSQSRGFYIRLILLSTIEMCGTVPLASYLVASDVRQGVMKWNWTDVHRNYSRIPQIPKIEWKNNPKIVSTLEMFRWSLVLCAFIFFAFFGLAVEAWQHYRCLYRWLARHVRSLVPSDTFFRSSRRYVVQRVAFECLGSYFFRTTSSPHLKKESAGRMVFAAKPGRSEDPTGSLSDQLSIPCACVTSNLGHESKVKRYSHSVMTVSCPEFSSADGSQDQIDQLPTATSASVLASDSSPQPADMASSTIQPRYTDSADVAVAV
jgi:Pheromone A receptor